MRVPKCDEVTCFRLPSRGVRSDCSTAPRVPGLQVGGAEKTHGDTGLSMRSEFLEVGGKADALEKFDCVADEFLFGVARHIRHPDPRLVKQGALTLPADFGDAFRT